MLEAAVMLIIKDGLILGVSRKHDSTKFGLPGGKLDPGETPIRAAIRETMEETKIKVTSYTFLLKRIEPAEKPNGLPFNTSCFYANSWSGEPSRSEEGEVKWVSKEELAHGAFPEYNLETLEIFQALYPDVFIQ